MRILMAVMVVILAGCGGGRPAGEPCPTVHGIPISGYCWCMMACPGGDGHPPLPRDDAGWCVLHTGACQSDLTGQADPGWRKGCGLTTGGASTSTGVYAIYTSATGC